MSLPSSFPSRIWPHRWSATLRDRLSFLRLLTLLLALLAFFGSSVAFGFAGRGPVYTAGTLAAMLALAALWAGGHRREGLSVGWLVVEVPLLLMYLLGVNPDFRPFGALYLALQHRVMYGTRRQATLVAIAYGAAFLVGNAFTDGDSSLGTPLALALQLAVGAFGAYVMHTLSEVLARDDERKRRLKASEERYRAMFDHNPWPMWLFEPGTTRIVEVNESAVRQYGYTRQEFLRMTLYDIRPESERAYLDEVRNATMRERATYRVRHLRRNGEVIDVEVTAHPVEFEGTNLLLAVAVDVSERERSERALRESESRFRSVANCLQEAVLITDGDDRIVLANDRVQDVLGYTPASVLGRSATELLLPVAQQNAFRDRLRRRLDGESELYEVELRRADGRLIVAEVSASPYRDASGAIIGTLGAISDITSRKQLEERVRQSSRLEAVGQLAGGVAHDFNNLLTVIKVHTELLRDELSPGDALQHSLQEIEGAADRAADVTGQLLAFSRRQLLQPRRVSLDHVVTESLPVLRKLAGRRIEIVTSTDGSQPGVFADPLQMENVLVTLVRNACEAMPRGGSITIGTESRDLGARDLAFQSQHLPGGSYTVLTVSDTGTGMDAGVLRRLFEPFFTTKEVGSGSGMGLASMFGIVRQSGGYVDVQSALGAGTTFTIYMPAIIQPAASPVGETATV
jgi:two-component system cell cycle sensor histidine kinase/response regulator CckA